MAVGYSLCLTVFSRNAFWVQQTSTLSWSHRNLPGMLKQTNTILPTSATEYRSTILGTQAADFKTSTALGRRWGKGGGETAQSFLSCHFKFPFHYDSVFTWWAQTLACLPEFGWTWFWLCLLGLSKFLFLVCFSWKHYPLSKESTNIYWVSDTVNKIDSVSAWSGHSRGGGRSYGHPWV